MLKDLTTPISILYRVTANLVLTMLGKPELTKQPRRFK